MSCQTFTLERKEGVEIISVLDLGKQGEVFSLADELAGLSAEIAGDETIRVVLLSGAGEKSISVETAPTGTSSSADLDPEKRLASGLALIRPKEAGGKEG